MACSPATGKSLANIDRSGAEAVDAVLDDHAEAVDGPVVVVGDEVGDLDRDVRLPRQLAKAVAPSRHALGVAVDRAAAVVEDERLVGEVAGKAGGVAELVGEDHEVEAEPVPPETGEAGAPGRVVHEVAARGEAAGRVRGPAEDIADADDARERRLGVEQGVAIGRRERHVGDIAAGDAAGLVEALQPLRLADAVVRPPARLDVDRRDDGLPRRVPSVVGGEVVAPERGEIAEAAMVVLARGQPRMAAHRQVPMVMVRVDDRPGMAAAHRFGAPAGGRPATFIPSPSIFAGPWRPGQRRKVAAIVAPGQRAASAPRQPGR